MTKQEFKTAFIEKIKNDRTFGLNTEISFQLMIENLEQLTEESYEVALSNNQIILKSNEILWKKHPENCTPISIFSWKY